MAFDKYFGIHKNLFIRHWMGEYSIARSSLNALLINVGFLAVVIATAMFFSINIRILSLMFWVLVFFGGITISWGLVGVWRAGEKQKEKRGKFLGFLTQGICVVVAVIFMMILKVMAHDLGGEYVFGRQFLLGEESEYMLYREQSSEGGCFAKPVIYLYPQKTTDVFVKLAYRGKLLTTYPKYDDALGGWKVTAYPDGQLVNNADNRTYSYLFWDGVTNEMKNDFSSGFVVAGKDTAMFLQQKLEAMGLTPKEYNEFIVYWLPKMEGNRYNLIHFAGSEYSDVAELIIEPKPDAVLRVFMIYKSLDNPIDVPEQKINPFERKGFSVVEWGGSEVK